MALNLWTMIGWILVGSILGFAISAVFAGWLKLSRTVFLIPYVTLISVFLVAFFVRNEISFSAILLNNWVLGILAGFLVSVFLVRNVRSQPASRPQTENGLAFNIVWAGLVYGIVDALFLNVMPVVAIGIGTSEFSWAGTIMGRLGVGLAGLAASLLITFTYHLGYPEFRNKQIGRTLVGNSIITLAFLLSGSPLGSLISHPVMHIAAVLHGSETTVQLPPHYHTGLNPSE